MLDARKSRWGQKGRERQGKAAEKTGHRLLSMPCSRVNAVLGSLDQYGATFKVVGIGKLVKTGEGTNFKLVMQCKAVFAQGIGIARYIDDVFKVPC